MKLDIGGGKDDNQNKDSLLPSTKNKKKAIAQAAIKLAKNSKKILVAMKTAQMIAFVSGLLAMIMAIVSVISSILSARTPIVAQDDDPCYIDVTSTLNGAANYELGMYYCELTTCFLKGLGLTDSQTIGAMLNIACEGAVKVTDSVGNAYKVPDPSKIQGWYGPTNKGSGTFAEWIENKQGKTLEEQLPDNGTMLGYLADDEDDDDGDGTDDSFGSSSAALGIIQWDAGRNISLVEFAESHGKQWYDIDAQLMFLASEFTGSEKLYFNSYKSNKPKTVDYSSFSDDRKSIYCWADYVERCTKGSYESSGAKRYIKDLQNGEVDFYKSTVAQVSSFYSNDRFRSLTMSLLSSIGEESSTFKNNNTGCFVKRGISDALIAQAAQMCVPNDEVSSTADVNNSILTIGHYTGYICVTDSSNINDLFQKYVSAVKAAASSSGSPGFATSSVAYEYSSCAAFVSTVIYQAGVASGFTPTQSTYTLHRTLSDNTNVWSNVTAGIVNGSDQLQAGDVLVKPSEGRVHGHTFIWVGADVMKSIAPSATIGVQYQGSGSLGTGTISADSDASTFEASLKDSGEGKIPRAHTRSVDSVKSELLGFNGNTSGYEVFRLKTSN